MIISIGFILLILFDFSKLFFENKTANSLFPAGLFCIGIGAFRGEAQEVLVKGINICLECIGIG